MEINDIDFTAQDARRLVEDSHKRKEFINYKFHAQIIKFIRQRSSRRLYHFIYTLPVYLFGQQVYDPKVVLAWLTNRLRRDGFQVEVDYDARKLYINWKPLAEITSVGPKRRKKNVRFNLGENLFHQY